MLSSTDGTCHWATSFGEAWSRSTGRANRGSGSMRSSSRRRRGPGLRLQILPVRCRRSMFTVDRVPSCYCQWLERHLVPTAQPPLCHRHLVPAARQPQEACQQSVSSSWLARLRLLLPSARFAASSAGEAALASAQLRLMGRGALQTAQSPVLSALSACAAGREKISWLGFLTWSCGRTRFMSAPAKRSADTCTSEVGTGNPTYSVSPSS